MGGQGRPGPLGRAVREHRRDDRSASQRRTRRPAELERRAATRPTIPSVEPDFVDHGARNVLDGDAERGHLAGAVRLLTSLTDKSPSGWYTGRESPRTRRLVVEHGGFSYDIGRPGRIVALERLVEHVAAHDRVWICRRAEIASHWPAAHPYAPG